MPRQGERLPAARTDSGWREWEAKNGQFAMRVIPDMHRKSDFIDTTRIRVEKSSRYF
jgi:hypothetical protein